MFVMFKHTSSTTEEGVLQNTSDTHTHASFLRERKKIDRTILSLIFAKRESQLEKSLGGWSFLFSNSQKTFSFSACLPHR